MDFSNFVRNFLTFFIGISILAFIIFLFISLLPVILVIVLIMFIYNLLFTPKIRRGKNFYFYRSSGPYRATFSEETISNNNYDKRQKREEKGSNIGSIPSNIKEVEVEVRDPENKD